MNENAYRVRAERGEVQIGTWVTMIRTPAVLTLLKAAGLDFARIDMEHSPFSIETVADMAALARAMDFPMVVRPPEGNREWIRRPRSRRAAGTHPWASGGCTASALTPNSGACRSANTRRPRTRACT